MNKKNNTTKDSLHLTLRNIVLVHLKLQNGSTSARLPKTPFKKDFTTLVQKVGNSFLFCVANKVSDSSLKAQWIVLYKSHCKLPISDAEN